MLHSPYCSTIDNLREPDGKLSYSIFELIHLKQWKKARQHVEENPESVYQLNEGKHRLAIHELCQAIPHPVDGETDGEISDDDEDDGQNARRPCFSCLKNENKDICELVQLLIETSFDLGPARIPVSYVNEEEEEGVADDSETRFGLHESILTVEDSLKKTPLHILCENSADTQLMKVIFDNTKENNPHPCAPSAHSLIVSVDNRGSTPLHYLSYSRQCPFSALQLMMDYCEATPDNDPTVCQDIEGDTPLHWALDGYMSARRIGQLVRHSTAALRVQNMEGKFPFDKFVANFLQTDWRSHDVVGQEAWETIQAYLKALVGWDEETGMEWLPLHVLASWTFNLPSVFHDIALYYNERGLSQPDSKGWLPLHLACALEETEEEGMKYGDRAVFYLKRYPQAAYRPTNDTKQLPVHIAIGTQKPWSLISSLLAVYPSSLNIYDPYTGLWPFLLAGSKNSDSVDTSYNLLRADPSIMNIAIRKIVSQNEIRAENALRNISIDDREEYSAKRVSRGRQKLSDNSIERKVRS
eukprot:scaffold26564_cov122-Cylindrotheca_fusiformis.AAC.3